jgi:hypothetical protein
LRPHPFPLAARASTTGHIGTDRAIRCSKVQRFRRSVACDIHDRRLPCRFEFFIRTCLYPRASVSQTTPDWCP